jgi:hypothetical protein
VGLPVTALFVDRLATEKTLSKVSRQGSAMVEDESSIVAVITVPTLDILEAKNLYFTGEARSEVFRACLQFDASKERTSPTIYKSKTLRKITAMERLDTSSWSFFRSPKGYMGLAPAPACYTDYICILLGASVPFILSGEGGYYVIIWEAYVHGFMYAEQSR